MLPIEPMPANLILAKFGLGHLGGNAFDFQY